MFKEILLPIDLNHESSWRKALPAALDYCQAFGSKLHVMTVTPDFGLPMVAQFFPDDYEKKMLEAVSQKLQDFVSENVPEGIAVQTVVGHGSAYEEIIRVARKIDVDLIIMASHRPEKQEFLIGSTAARVVRHARRSVMVVRE